MSQPLPRLRMNLDFMPSPVEDRPGLLIRDSYGYSEAVLIVPPPLVACLQYFDGEQTDGDLRATLVQITGELDVSPLIEQLSAALRKAGFLEDEIYGEMRERREREFASSPVRQPAHAGSAYPEEAGEARSSLREYMIGAEPGEASVSNLVGIAAPHVSPFGGWQTYRAAYSSLNQDHQERTFVILGTSHYGQPDRFGLTRKAFVTPLGEARTDAELVNWLAQEPAALMEDYCHAVEHSIEFQVLFLQYLFGPDIRIVPILCGSFARSILAGGMPEDNEGVKSFLGQLGELQAREGQRLLWVLGIDMAHMGTRYGDRMKASAYEDGMRDVERRDRERIQRANEGDAEGFWKLVQERGDDLKWCGSSPMYTFLRAVPEARGTLRGYEQWNIDSGSIVSFAGLSFS